MILFVKTTTSKRCKEMVEFALKGSNDEIEQFVNQFAGSEEDEAEEDLILYLNSVSVEKMTQIGKVGIYNTMFFAISVLEERAFEAFLSEIDNIRDFESDLKRMAQLWQFNTRSTHVLANFLKLVTRVTSIESNIIYECCVINPVLKDHFKMANRIEEDKVKAEQKRAKNAVKNRRKKEKRNAKMREIKEAKKQAAKEKQKTEREEKISELANNFFIYTAC